MVVKIRISMKVNIYAITIIRRKLYEAICAFWLQLSYVLTALKFTRRKYTLEFSAIVKYSVLFASNRKSNLYLLEQWMNESNALCNWKAHGWASGLIQHVSQFVESSWLLSLHSAFRNVCFTCKQALLLVVTLISAETRTRCCFGHVEAQNRTSLPQALNKMPKFWVICPPLSYMWKLDHKEGWASTNWCFQTVVLENTLESPFDYKVIQPVHPKGNQPWIFIGRTNAKPEIPILWPPDAKSWLTGKDPDAGKDWVQDEKGTQRMRWLDGIIDSNEHEFEQTLGDGEGQGSLPCCSPWCHKESDRTEWLNNNMAITESKVWPDDKTDFKAIRGLLYNCRWVDSILNWWLLHSEHKCWGNNANTYYGMQIYMYTCRYIYAQI